MTDHDCPEIVALRVLIEKLDSQIQSHFENLQARERVRAVEIVDAIRFEEVKILTAADIRYARERDPKTTLHIDVKDIKWSKVVPRRTTVPFTHVDRTPRIVRPPGGRLGHVLGFLLTRRAYDKLVAPVIADAQHEYVEAVAAGNDRHAQWIAIRLHFIVWYGWVYGLFASMIRRVIGVGTGG